MLSAHPAVPLESFQFVNDPNGGGRRLSLTTATGHVLQTQRGVVRTPNVLTPFSGTPEEGSPEEGGTPVEGRSGTGTPDGNESGDERGRNVSR